MIAKIRPNKGAEMIPNSIAVTPSVLRRKRATSRLAFPFIRYDLGDAVTLLPGRCACGSSLVRIADIAGRRDDDFHYPEGTIPASAFRHVLGTEPRISEYQVRQTASGAEVLVVGDPDATLLAASLRAALRPYGLPDADITISQVARIERHAATGKLKRFIALAD